MKLPAKCLNLVYCIVLMVLAGSGSALWGQTGGFAYVANCGSVCGGIGSGNVSAYTIDGTTGALISNIPGSPFPAGAGSNSATVHPTGQFAYVSSYGSNSVSAYTINGTTGALTPVAGS